MAAVRAAGRLGLIVNLSVVPTVFFVDNYIISFFYLLIIIKENFMADLKELFGKAVQESTQLPERPGMMDLMYLYAHFKQGTEGDCTGEEPDPSDMVAYTKYEAWKNLAGTAKEAAMQKYIDKVNELKG